MILDENNNSISGPSLVVCEGRSDASFLDHLLVQHGITGFEFGFPTDKTAVGHGKSGIPSYLLGLRASSGFPRISNLVLAIDNDTNPEEATQFARKAIGDAIGSDVPDAPYIMSEGSPSVGFITFPKAGEMGCLEHILLEAAVSAHATLAECTDDFVNCVEVPNSWPANKQAKMRLQIMISASCRENPTAALSWVWSNTENPIPIGSESFNYLAEFFQNILAD